MADPNKMKYRLLICSDLDVKCFQKKTNVLKGWLAMMGSGEAIIS